MNKDNLSARDRHVLSSLYYRNNPLMPVKQFDECCQKLRVVGYARKANDQWVITPAGIKKAERSSNNG